MKLSPKTLKTNPFVVSVPKTNKLSEVVDKTVQKSTTSDVDDVHSNLKDMGRNSELFLAPIERNSASWPPLATTTKLCPIRATKLLQT